MRVGDAEPSYRRAPRRGEDTETSLARFSATTPPASPSWPAPARSASAEPGAQPRRVQVLVIDHGLRVGLIAGDVRAGHVLHGDVGEVDRRQRGVERRRRLLRERVGGGSGRRRVELVEHGLQGRVAVALLRRRADGVRRLLASCSRRKPARRAAARSSRSRIRPGGGPRARAAGRCCRRRRCAAGCRSARAGCGASQQVVDLVAGDRVVGRDSIVIACG